MKIIKPYAEFMQAVDGIEILKHLERCGRICYKSEDKITEDSAKTFLRSVIKRGHGAVLEHAGLTVRMVCDRGVSHELVRHRIASYCQESTRYCNYEKDQFGNEITVIEPFFLTPGTKAYHIWREACEVSEQSYMDLLRCGCPPQESRAVLPNSLKTEIAVTMNIREWRHFFTLRCSPAAHPQMQEIAQITLRMFAATIPVLFDDIFEEVFNARSGE